MEQTGNKIIAKNATMLYIRMFFTMAISFYTSRIVLEALGVSDYGIYNVVGGVIVMISTITGALGSASSRFLTFALGMKDLEILKITFSTAFYIHLFLAILFVVVSESVGVWFVNTHLVIPEGRMTAANWVFQSAIISTALSITQTPFSASIISHERMGAFAYIDIANAISKLGIAYAVILSEVDHLILYSILYMLLSVGFQIYYQFYCIRNFKECHVMRNFNKQLFKKMISFSGWSMSSGVSLTISQQGTNVLINWFFGTIINAAVGVAGQVQAILSAFTGNIPVAFNPQIIKEYAAGNHVRVNALINMGTKLAGTVSVLMAVPIIFNLNFLMSIWLDEVPVGAVVICSILLTRNVFNSFNPCVACALNATGNIKQINILLSSLYLLTLILSYFLLLLIHSYVIIYVVGSLSSFISVYLYVYYLKKHMPAFEARRYLVKTYFPLMCIFLISSLIAWQVSALTHSSLICFLSVSIISVSIIALTSFFIVMDKNTRNTAVNLIKNIIKQ